MKHLSYCIVCGRNMKKPHKWKGTKLDARRVTDTRLCAKIYNRVKTAIYQSIKNKLIKKVKK